MLTAFTARPIIELKQRDKSKIETILAYGDRVFVGLNTGSLRIYRLNDLPPPAAPLKPANGSSAKPDASSGNGAGGDDASTAPEPSQPPAPAASAAPAVRPTDLLREAEKFATRAIEQLAIIKEANTLVSLSGSAVHLHDLQTLEPLGEGYAPLPRTRGASCFAVTSNIVRDPEAGDIPEIISRLAVAVKRRLLLWSWRESELADEAAEVVLAESIRSVTWASATRVVCGMNAGYVVVDVLTRAAEEVNAPGPPGGAGSRFGAMSSTGMSYMGLGGYMPKPLAAKLADGQMLLAKDINTLFITDEGKPLDKRQIPWQSAPESVGYSYPYILALQPPAKGSLEVRNPDTLSLLQTIALPGAAQLHVPPPTVSLAHAGKGFHISSERAVWKMDATDYDAQVGELVAAGRLDEAISVLGMLEDPLLRDKAGTLREVKMQKAELLFRQRRYRESMDLFNEDEVHAPPERVLRLFPRLIAGELAECDDDSDKDKDKDSSESDEGDDAAAAGGANGKAAANGAKADAPAEAAAASPPKTAAGGFTKMFLGHRRINSETASIASSRRADADDAASIAGKGTDEGHRPLEGKDLMSAVLELRGFLAGTRQRLQRAIDPVTGKLKQPKAPPGGGGPSPEAAFRSILTTTAAGDESDEALERELRATFRLVDTALFRAYMFSAPTLASSLFRIPNFCDPDVVNERLLATSRYNELVDFFYGKRLHRQALELLRQFGAGDAPDDAAPGLHGPQRTVAYLQNLPPEMIDLILEFSAWALRADPDRAMDVFVADTENAETLPRDRVAAFLGGLDPGLEARYLEHVIAELNDMTPDFHNRLVELYVERLSGGGGGLAAGAEERGPSWRAEMERLVRFLKESRQYGMRKAFGLLPKDDPDFYEAEAVVLSAMGQDKQALEIYVFKMKDYAKAEEYCNRVHKAQETSRPASPAQPRTSAPADDEADGDGPPPSIYHTLLSLYLTPPPPHAPSLGPALDLLSKHGSRLPAASTLALIPDAMPVAELESYFRGRMRTANSVVNEARVAAGLRKTELVASQALLLLGDGGAGGGQGGRSRRVVVADERVCGACHKRLGGSVVAVLPDNAVVHYGCLGRATGQQPHGRAEGRAPSWGRSSAY